MASPWVQRNLDNAQYPHSRGSTYEGPILATDREAQDYSIHLEELDFARAKNAHYDHYRLQGFMVEGCPFCLAIEREFTA